MNYHRLIIKNGNLIMLEVENANMFRKHLKDKTYKTVVAYYRFYLESIELAH